jgi:hypothetical protein
VFEFILLLSVTVSIGIGTVFGYALARRRLDRRVEEYERKYQELSQAVTDSFKSLTEQLVVGYREQAEQAKQEVREYVAADDDSPAGEAVARMLAEIDRLTALAGKNPILLQAIGKNALPAVYQMIGQVKATKLEIQRTKERMESLNVALIQVSGQFWNCVRALAQDGLSPKEAEAIGQRLKAVHETLGRDLTQGIGQLAVLLKEIAQVAETRTVRAVRGQTDVN